MVFQRNPSVWTIDVYPVLFFLYHWIYQYYICVFAYVFQAVLPTTQTHTHTTPLAVLARLYLQLKAPFIRPAKKHLHFGNCIAIRNAHLWS